MRKTGLQVENLVVVFTASISDSVVKDVGMEWCFSQLFLISLETQYWFRMDESLPPLFCSVLSCSCNQSAENHSTAPPILFPPTLLFINKINRISAEKNIGSPLPPVTCSRQCSQKWYSAARQWWQTEVTTPFLPKSATPDNPKYRPSHTNTPLHCSELWLLPRSGLLPMNFHCLGFFIFCIINLGCL